MDQTIEHKLRQEIIELKKDKVQLLIIVDKMQEVLERAGNSLERDKREYDYVFDDEGIKLLNWDLKSLRH